MRLARLEIRRVVYVVPLLLPSLCVAAPVPDAVLDTLSNVTACEARGSYGDAERLLQKSLQSLTESEGRDAVLILNEIGHVHQEQERLRDAEADYQKALAINSRLKEPDQSEKATSLNNLGTLKLLRGQLQEAEQEVRAARSILVKAGLADSGPAGIVFSNSCFISQKLGKYDEARQFCARANRPIAQQKGERSLEYAKFLVVAGLLSFGTGDYRDAIGKDRSALEIEACLPAVPTVDIANSKNNLGMVLMRVGALPEAEKLLTDAVKLYRLGGPRDELRLAEALNLLASTNRAMDKYEAAAQYAHEGLALSLQLTGPQSELSATFHNDLGCLALRQKKWNVAGKEFADALHIFAMVKSQQSIEYAATLGNMGTLEDHTGKHKEAEARYRAALQVHQALLGPDHPQIAEDYSNIAAELVARKQWDDALDFYRRALPIRAKAYGYDSVQVANTWRDIGIVNCASKRLGRADEAYAQAITIYRSSPAANTAQFGHCLREYAELLRSLKRFTEAENADLQAMRIEVTGAIRAEKAATSVPALSFD